LSGNTPKGVLQLYRHLRKVPQGRSDWLFAGHLLENMSSPLGDG
jgi:hypothetical protein